MAVRSTASGELVYASEIEFEFLGKAKDAIVPIWPPNSGAVRWPAAQAMTQQDIEVDGHVAKSGWPFSPV